MPEAFTSEQLEDIQGFGIAGFNKDHQELLFVRVGDPVGGRRLLSWLQSRTASAWEVGTFNQLFKEIKGRTNNEPLAVTWIAVLISAAGYQALGISTSGLPAGDGTAAFNGGMASRAPNIGDTGPLDVPTSWLTPFRPGEGVHLCIVAAADEPDDLDEAVTTIGEQISACNCEVVYQERGETLPSPFVGHEHFGFKDGISQPAIDGYDVTPLPNEPPVAPPGEFVLGYPSASGPATQLNGNLWTNGSFAVFRRLHQNVAAFRNQAAAGVPGSSPLLTADQSAAALVGRWPSGAPLEINPISDPGPTSISNAFGYKASLFNDDDGHVCPRFAHIRKANPRDESTPSPADDPAQHRMIRRGIPFGPLLPPGITDDGTDRGLHFFCVVSDVVRQFEFIQSSWLNQANFPSGQAGPTPGTYSPPSQRPPDGPDPVVGEGTTGRSCLLVQASGDHAFPITAQFVNVTAGEYFFVPSLTALSELASGISQ